MHKLDTDPASAWEIDILSNFVNFKNCFFQDDQGMGDWFKSKNYKTPCEHINAEGHKLWGQAFSRFINNCI